MITGYKVCLAGPSWHKVIDFVGRPLKGRPYFLMLNQTQHPGPNWGYFEDFTLNIINHYDR